MRRLSFLINAPLLLTTVVGIALISGIVSFVLGSESLKGVNQIDLKPLKGTKAAKTDEGVIFGETIPFLKESDLITDVKARIKGDIKSGKTKPGKK
jgi:hypothetical protein